MEKRELMSQLAQELKILLSKYSLNNNTFTLLESNELRAFIKKLEPNMYLDIKIHNKKLEFSTLEKLPKKPRACCAWCSEENVVYCCVEGQNCGEK